uniref:Putative tubulin-specific chaperone c pediculus us corporis tubulin-specific chaperone c n=1 Tax=Ixodes ricinus TaxID=34613 RepID=A0A6B0V904_IXORI
MALYGRERTDAFLSSFGAACSRLEKGLSEPSPQLGDQLQDLQKMLTEAAAYLPPRLLHRAQEDLKRLRAEVVSSQPKKRFAFTTKHSGTATSSEALEPLKPVHQVSLPDKAVGLRHRSGETLHLTDVDGRPLELDSLEDCCVTVHGNPAALFATRLSRCELRCGPVTTSAFVEHCRDSRFWLACQQLRVHSSSQCQSALFATRLSRCELRCGPVTTSAFVEHCRDSRFWLACQQLRVHSSSQCQFRMHVQSRAIVEDSTGLGFGAYDWQYEGQEDHWRASGLDPSCNQWRQVDDFNCPMARSPNWTFLKDDPDNSLPVHEQPS